MHLHHFSHCPLFPLPFIFGALYPSSSRRPTCNLAAAVSPGAAGRAAGAAASALSSSRVQPLGCIPMAAEQMEGVLLQGAKPRTCGSSGGVRSAGGGRRMGHKSPASLRRCKPRPPPSRISSWPTHSAARHTAANSVRSSAPWAHPRTLCVPVASVERVKNTTRAKHRSFAARQHPPPNRLPPPRPPPTAPPLPPLAPDRHL